MSFYSFIQMRKVATLRLKFIAWTLSSILLFSSLQHLTQCLLTMLGHRLVQQPLDAHGPGVLEAVPLSRVVVAAYGVGTWCRLGQMWATLNSCTLPIY